MLKFTLKSKIIRSAAGVAATGLMVGSSVIGGAPAGADPKQFSALRGVGSDTTQDVVNAFAGFTNDVNYPPLQSDTASGKRQIVSFDAILAGSDCITTTPGGPSFLRPNGSTNGRKALSRAIGGGTPPDNTWPGATTLCGGVKDISGQVDFARSSSGPGAGSPNLLSYVPFGRDGLGFAYYRSAGAPVTTLTSAQLTSLFSTGPQNIGGVDIVPCGIQTGSGTYGSWNTALGITTGQEGTGTLTCNPTPADRLQENDGTGLKTKGDLPAFAGKQVIVGFSAANFIAQTNGVAKTQLPPGLVVDLGAIDALGKPYTGPGPGPTAPLAASATYYANTTYGRDVYNVVPIARFGGLGGVNGDFKSMFRGPTSTVCQATSTIIAFGFSTATVVPCGDTTTVLGPSIAD